MGPPVATPGGGAPEDDSLFQGGAPEDDSM